MNGGGDPPETETELQLARSLERLRQEKAVFEQRKTQDWWWNLLRLVAGFATVVMLISVLVGCFAILFGEGYSKEVQQFAGAALCGDVLGVLAGAWKIVLSPSDRNRLSPTVEIARGQEGDVNL